MDLFWFLDGLINSDNFFKSISQVLFTMDCFLCDGKWIFKYYVDEFQASKIQEQQKRVADDTGKHWC
jgi:hypothetical protein